MEQKKSGLRYRVRKTGPRRSPQAVELVLKNAFRRFGLDKKIASYRFVLHWKEIVGEEIAKRAFPERIQRDVLSVRVTSSVWAQELTFQKSVIIHRLQKYLGEDQTVRDIRFYVGT